MSGTCRRCQKIVKRHDGDYECRGAPPSLNPDDPDAPGRWPIIHPDEPACGVWLDRMNAAIVERPDIYGEK